MHPKKIVGVTSPLYSQPAFQVLGQSENRQVAYDFGTSSQGLNPWRKTKGFMTDPTLTRVHGDFNGVFNDKGGQLLCLSHKDTCVDAKGQEVVLREGMRLTAFAEDDFDEHGNPDYIIASGIVECSPDWLRCSGSRWVLRIDQDGVRRESDLHDESQVAVAASQHAISGPKGTIFGVAVGQDGRPAKGIGLTACP